MVFLTMFSTEKIPLSLYIHIPWCVRKCPYCDFNSHTLETDFHDTQREAEYIDALIEDFQQDWHWLQQNNQVRPLHSIFIGGGTPSLLKPESYERLFEAIFKEATVEENIEITLEANPGTVDEQHFKGFHKAGINRISLGVQSFNPTHLKKLGRIHTGEQAANAFQIAREAGFNNINMDLMFGLPDQTLEEALSDIHQAMALKPEHLSWYQLTLEPNTVFYKYPPILPNEDKLWTIEVAGKKCIGQHYQQYEISAYARDEKLRSQHNLNYWLYGDYLGIGAGAHGKITIPNGITNELTIWRTQKKRQPKDYIHSQTTEKKFLAQKDPIAPHEIPFEFMLNALRLFQPIAYDLLKQRTPILLENLQKTLIIAKQKKLVFIHNNTFEVTTLGHQYLNNLQEMFLDNSNQ